MASRVSSELTVLRWVESGIAYVDARALADANSLGGEPVETIARDATAVLTAIAAGAVRGDRCIDIFGAFGVALACRAENGHAPSGGDVARAVRQMATTDCRPARTWAVERVAQQRGAAAVDAARAAYAENLAIDRAIADAAAALLPSRGRVLTHGTTGAMETGGAGTALAAIIAARRAGKVLAVFHAAGAPSAAPSTDILELQRAGVPTTRCAAAAVAWVLQNAQIAAVIVGAAAIAANGDSVGEIGTYGIALAAAAHRIPFYVAAPRACVDHALRHAVSASVPQRPPLTAASPHDAHDAQKIEPLLDVTPGRLVTAIVTEFGIARPPFDESLATLASRPNFAQVARDARRWDAREGGGKV